MHCYNLYRDFQYENRKCTIASFFFQNDVPANEKEITPEEVLTWCQEFHVVSFIETSAKTSENVSAAFVMAVREWKKCERNKDLIDGGDRIDLAQRVHLDAKSRTTCCSGSSLPTRQTHHEVLQ